MIYPVLDEKGDRFIILIINLPLFLSLDSKLNCQHGHRGKRRLKK